jgi:hypothetical protein
MSAKKSKFGFLTESLQSHDATLDEETSAPEPTSAPEEAPPSPALSVVQAAEPASKPKAKPRAQSPEAPGTSRPVGRPRGKRSDGDHVQVTAYIRRETHLDVKTALLREQQGRDFSELVEELLAKWLRSRT